jgi:hypothetical protein
VDLGKKLELARILSRYVGRDEIYTVVEPLFTEKSVSALRVSVFKALNKVPDDVDRFLEGLINEDEHFFEGCIMDGVETAHLLLAYGFLDVKA